MNEIDKEDIAVARAVEALKRLGHAATPEEIDLLRRAARQQHAALDALRRFELTDPDPPHG